MCVLIERRHYSGVLYSSHGTTAPHRQSVPVLVCRFGCARLRFCVSVSSLTLSSPSRRTLRTRALSTLDLSCGSSTPHSRRISPPSAVWCESHSFSKSLNGSYYCTAQTKQDTLHDCDLRATRDPFSETVLSSLSAHMHQGDALAPARAWAASRVGTRSSVVGMRTSLPRTYQKPWSIEPDPTAPSLAFSFARPRVKGPH